MTPETHPHPTPTEWATAVSELRNRLMRERKRAFPPGSSRTCPVCSKEALESRDDLLRELVVGSMALVHHNLHGARCAHCGVEILEAYEQIALEEGGPERTLSDYQAKVTRVSGRNLGTYWPQDVVRAMGLHKEDALRVQILDKDTMIIVRRREKGEAESPRSSKPVKGRKVKGSPNKPVQRRCRSPRR